VILTDILKILSHTVSKLSQIIVQILDEKWPLCVFELLLGIFEVIARILFIFGSLESAYWW